MAIELISRAEARAKGLKRYFLGTACQKGHIAERQVSSCKCLECERLKNENKRRSAGIKPVSLLGATLRAEAVKNGHRRYFTGMPCRYGHVAERQVADGNCVECARIGTKAFLEKNPHKRKLYNKKYYDKDPAKIRDRGKSWREKNPDKEKSRTRIYRDNNRDKTRAAVAAWAKKNPLKRCATEAARRARKRGGNGSHTAQDILDIYEMQRGRCAYCRIKLKNKYHVDHIIPLAKGGPNDRKNLQILCGPKCNCAKGAKDPIEFARELGRLL